MSPRNDSLITCLNQVFIKIGSDVQSINPFCKFAYDVTIRIVGIDSPHVGAVFEYVKITMRSQFEAIISVS